MAAPQVVRLGRRPHRLEDIPGWFKRTDAQLFEWLLTKAAPDSGDLLEIGVYHGKSAILMGSFLRPGERFTVCDLFDGAGEDTSIHPAERRRYREFSRSVFERNHLAFHDQLPTIVCAPSSTIVDHVKPGSLRFAHVDGSHLYHHVRQDLLSVRRLLRPDGVVASDDYRAEHCPGTAEAVWEGVVNDGLRPICVTPNKLYGTWGDPEAIQSPCGAGAQPPMVSHRPSGRNGPGSRASIPGEDSWPSSLAPAGMAADRRRCAAAYRGSGLARNQKAKPHERRSAGPRIRG